MTNTWWKDPSELVKEQMDLLDLSLDENILIKGPPGSGKTNLLLLRANYLYLGDQPNLYIVVFGSVLRSFIQLGGGEYKFPAEKIITHSRLFSQVLRENDVRIDTTGMNITEARIARAGALATLIKEGKVGEIFDALILDEAQDYMPDEIRIFRALTKVLIAAADSRQKVYEVDDPSDTLVNCVDKVYELHYHFRNGRDICRLADGIMRGKLDHTPLITHSSYDESAYPSRVTPRSGLKILEQATAIAEQINDQRLAYPNDLIGVLCPRNEEVEAIADFLHSTSLASEVTRCNASDFDPSRHIWLTTITAAKGLEFRAVHMAGLDFLSRMGAVQRRLAFTGVTRAKTALSLYYEKGIPGYLDSALRAISPEKKAITKLSIFGKG